MFKTIYKAFFFLACILLTLLIILWFIGKKRVAPKVWQPLSNPGLVSEYAPNNALETLKSRPVLAGPGPEDIAYDGQRYFYTGVEDGRIFKFDSNFSMQEFANTEGRPLGMQFDANGQLIVADADKGLLSISQQGEITVLTDSVDGNNLRFVDDLDIATDGTIWFSDASQRFGYDRTMHDFVEASFTGRLLSYSPTTELTKVHIDGLFFANGVALGPNDEYVLVNETGTSRIHRLWLKGENQGVHDHFVDALPGNPDNLSFNGKETFWVALPSKRDPLVDQLADKPLIRTLLGGLPINLLKPKDSKAFVLGLGLNGEVKYNFQTSQNHFNSVTSVNQYGGRLYLGSLHEPAFAVYELEE